MKRTLFFFSSFFSVTLLSAQVPEDALRFSWTVPSGTARQQAIGGAMGSLGGDLTALYVNPAGLAFYKTGDFALSPSYRFAKNKATYLGHKETEKDNAFTFGTTGFVIGSGRQGGKVRNVAFSVGFNTTGSFKSDILYRGANTQSSFSEKFLEDISPADDSAAAVFNHPFGAGLAVQTGWLYKSSGAPFQSRSLDILSSGLLQQQTIKARGGIYEFALVAAANLNDRWMVGGTFGIPVLHYERESSFAEVDALDDATNQFNFGTFDENLTTKGAGINLKAGVIYKPQEFWRLGFSVHTPTLYSLTDNYEASVTSDIENTKGIQTAYSDNSEFKYRLVSPYKLIASVSYVLREIEDVTKQRGFITADVEFVNHKASSFKTDEESDNQETRDYYNLLNDAIDNAYKSAFNFRLGGELKFTTLMVRLGAAYYSNPYQDINGEKGSKLNLTGGLGYRNKGMFIDLAYVHSINKDTHFPYRLEFGPYSGANIKTTGGNVLMTVGFKL